MNSKSNPIRVMVVDRNQSIQSWLSDCLESSATNYQISVAQTYEAGLEAMGGNDQDVFIVANVQDYVTRMDALIDQSVRRMLPLIVIGESDDLGMGDDLVAKGASEFLYFRQVSGNLLDRLIRNTLERQNRTRKLLHQQDDLSQLVRRDPLTGLVSRMVLHKQIEAMLCTDSQAGAMLYLNIDNFKAINARYGHLAGDEILQAVAVRLVESVRPNDVVSRFGGDEFLIYLAMEVDDQMLGRTVDGVCEKILKMVAKSYQLMLPNNSEVTRIQLSASMGVALTPGDSSEYVDLVHMANQSMYQAKALGSSTVYFHNVINPRADLEQSETDSTAVTTGQHRSPLGFSDKDISPFDP